MRAWLFGLGIALAPAALAQEMLLIPDTTTDTVGQYDRLTGDYIGDLIIDPDPTPLGIFDTPIHAVRGPDDFIYVSDQTRDAVLRFTSAGLFVDVFADVSDGLDNVRGLAFVGDDLLVCNAPAEPALPSIARFDSAGNRSPDFVTNLNCFDAHATPGGVVVTDIGNDRVSLLDPAGQPLAELAVTDFPEQIARKRNGNLLIIAYLSNEIVEISTLGSIVRRLPIANLGRGIVELGNGNLLITTGTGIREINPVSGAVIRTVRTGNGFRFIERVNFGSNCVYQGCDAGDVNGDCAVDLTDLSSLLANFGIPQPQSGDLNGDGIVDIVDLGQLLSVYGNDCR